MVRSQVERIPPSLQGFVTPSELLGDHPAQVVGVEVIRVSCRRARQQWRGLFELACRKVHVAEIEQRGKVIRGRLQRLPPELGGLLWLAALSESKPAVGERGRVTRLR